MTSTIFRKKLLMLATITVLVTGLTLTTTLDDAEAKKAKNADVSVWDSDIALDPFTGIFPIGGSGQIAGNFAVETKDKKDTTMQVGLRAQDRFDGPIEPIKGVYIVPTGESTPGLRAWNFDFSIDSGSEFLVTQLGKEITTSNLEDFDVVLEIKDAEKNKFKLDFDLGGVNANPVGPIVLSQQSWNIGFGFLDIPVDSEAYKISLSVLEDDGKKGKKIAKSKITVLVTDQVPEDGKLDICHKDKTKSVSVKSVAKHIEKHGDTIGPCTE